MAALSNPASQSVLGEDPLGKLKSHMTEVMTPHQFIVFSGQYVPTLQEREAASISEIELALQKLPADSVEALLSAYIGHLSTCRNNMQVRFFCSLLPKLVEKQVLTAKLLCNSLISNMNFDQEVVWCQCLETLKKQIVVVDYKGCRDVLRSYLSKIASLPIHLPQNTRHRVDKTVEVLKFILSRNTNLLPTYMAQTERALSFDGSMHWIIDDVLHGLQESFKPLACAVSLPGRRFLMPVIGTSTSHNFLWKVDPNKFSFPCKGALPFLKEVHASQRELLIRVIRQPCSRDLLMHMLTLEKKTKRQQQPVVEDLVADAVVRVMDEAERGVDNQASAADKERWRLSLDTQWYNFACLLSHFSLHGFVSIPDFVTVLLAKVNSMQLGKAGRDDLMWLLLQVIGTTLSRVNEHAAQMLVCIDIYARLFPEKEPIPVPLDNDPLATKKMATVCLVYQLFTKLGAAAEKHKIPENLKLQQSALEKLVARSPAVYSFDTFHDAVCLNAACIQQTVNKQLVARLGELLNGPALVYANPPHGTQPTTPLSMAFLDSLTVHVKMSVVLHLTNMFYNHSAQFQRGLPPSPAMLETYCRLIHSFEIEYYGVKNFQATVLPTVIRNRSLPTMNALTEMLAFHVRLHHIQPHYRINLLKNVHHDSSSPSASSSQMHLNAESAALKFIASCAYPDMHREFARLGGDIKLLLVPGAEELNRALALNIARGLHVSGCDRHASAWVDGIMKTLRTQMDVTWPSQVLHCMPQSLQDYFPLCTVQLARQEIIDAVEQEWPAFQAMNAEAAVSHFKQTSPHHTFFCLMWKQLLETEHLTVVCLRVLESLTSQQLDCHIRTFCDYLVSMHMQQPALQEKLAKGITAVSELIWKYDILPLDKLVLTMVMRNYNTPQARVCFFIIQLLLLKSAEFRNRIGVFVKEVSSPFWLSEVSYAEHQRYLKAFPEKFHYEGLAQSVGEHVRKDSSFNSNLGNLCVRFLPVCDLLIHRMIEMVSVLEKSLITLMGILGHLYKFHDQPALFLYSTLHYYEGQLAQWPLLKRKMVAAIIGSLQHCRPKGWCLSPSFHTYLGQQESSAVDCWVPGNAYYKSLLQKLVYTFSGQDGGFPIMDWRFVEFSNATDMAVHVTCLELLALPCSGERIVTDLLAAMIDCVLVVPDEETVMAWINAVACLLVKLPESYWGTLMNRVRDFIASMETEEAAEMNESGGMLPDEDDSSQLGLGIKAPLIGWEHCNRKVVKRWRICLTMARVFWHHSTIGQISGLSEVIRNRLRPVVRTERQLLFVLQMVGPSLHRMNEERTRCLLDLVVEIHAMLKNVDAHADHLDHMDTFCDYLYHLKYMFVGEFSKEKLEDVFSDLRPALQARLRFMMAPRNPV